MRDLKYPGHGPLLKRYTALLMQQLWKIIQHLHEQLSEKILFLLMSAFIFCIMGIFFHISPLPLAFGFTAIATAALILENMRQTTSPGSKKSRPLQNGERQIIGFQTLLEAMPEPAILLEANGTALYLNQTARDLFPSGREYQHLSSFIRDPDFLEALRQTVQQQETREVIYSPRVPVERKIRVTLSVLQTPGGGTSSKSHHILLSFRDLTEQERLSQMRSDFIANASHELRTPLASVLGFIDTLQGPAKKDEAAREDFLKIMRQQVERMTRLIDDLLSLSRVEMLAHLRPSDVVDLKDVAEYVLATLTPLARQSEISLSLETELETADVSGARDELIQVLQNLTQNAIKYGHHNGYVRVRLSRLPGKDPARSLISVAVEDNGPGVAPEHLPRLTERFYRPNVQHSRQKGGTGLGLAIVKHIVNRHRGELKIESRLGVGSTFTFVLPSL